jgi:hypothetical protein
LTGRFDADAETFGFHRMENSSEISMMQGVFCPCGLLYDDLTCWAIGQAVIQTCINGL